MQGTGTGIKEVILQKDRRYNKIIRIQFYKGFKSKVKILLNKCGGKNLFKHIKGLLVGMYLKKRYIFM